MRPLNLLSVLIATCIVYQHRALAQLVVDGSSTPQQLVQNVLIGGGVTVSNIQYTGATGALGFFNGQNSNIGLGSGILLSSGLAADAVGPNNVANDMGTDHTLPGDADLTTLSGSLLGTYDACILEFDFVPLSDSLSFRYVFGSNEYMQFVGSGVNDVFGFFISGPGIAGQQNIALVPGTGTSVSIDNVNGNTNQQYYVNNGDGTGAMGQTVEYNGFTTVLTANAVVQSCLTYHIRLAIADGGDGVYDSGVFLEAGSFTTPTLGVSGSASYSISNTQNELVEGCGSMTVSFSRAGDLSGALTVNLNVSGTATPGADFNNVPGSITFSPGQATVMLVLDMNSDGVTEGTETNTIALANVNPCAGMPPPSVTFTVQDHPGLSVSATPDTTIGCPGQITLTAAATGGIGTLTYNWQNSVGSTQQVQVSPLQTTVYPVTVTDACGIQATDDATVTIPGYEPMTLEVSNGTVCAGDELTLTATVVGGSGNIFFDWGGIGGPGPVFSFNPNIDQQMVVTATDSCGMSVNSTTYVDVTEASAREEHGHTSHSTLWFNAIIDAGAQATWDFGDGTTATGSNLEHTYADTGTFTVLLTVIDVNGCEAQLPFDVISYPEIRVYIPNTFTPDGNGLNDFFRPYGEGYLNFDLQILDRWGSLLFETFGTHRGWNGTFDGMPVKQGVYNYRAVLHPPVGRTEERMGAVFLVR